MISNAIVAVAAAGWVPTALRTDRPERGVYSGENQRLDSAQNGKILPTSSTHTKATGPNGSHSV
jgi:3-hydroxyisobutyrate dehydrogenase-like beta-hydroxyacid dehydrogenase